MNKKPSEYLLLIVLLLAGCNSISKPGQTPPIEPNVVNTSKQKNDQTVNPTVLSNLAAGSEVLKLEVIDRTAGESLSKEQLLTIRNEIIKQINDKYPTIKIANAEMGEIGATLRIFVDVFTAGNRALRFWIGFGSGKAHMRMTAEWLEGDLSYVKDSELYQRFGAASLRSGQSIEIQMTQLIGQYSVQFLSKYINQ
ncbi:MAG: hypothetical protein JETT_2011 [Candidatus Jettenia ecosi]|uniref:DUF4410 domain-containing protein n=1 Tax=Candidatus Jettenia ecosi TaxID=2494326 RepID=A0A533QAI5_9BACT|nr:MAG: hypothetical protein JETT_2011 [Candidatus Jettenia ecosi]